MAVSPRGLRGSSSRRRYAVSIGAADANFTATETMPPVSAAVASQPPARTRIGGPHRAGLPCRAPRAASLAPGTTSSSTRRSDRSRSRPPTAPSDRCADSRPIGPPKCSSPGTPSCRIRDAATMTSRLDAPPGRWSRRRPAGRAARASSVWLADDVDRWITGRRTTGGQLSGVSACS